MTNSPKITWKNYSKIMEKLSLMKKFQKRKKKYFTSIADLEAWLNQ
ncbi:MAG: hypothetical protein ACFCUV_14900 [Rivularia sp. (in: cyanobacteria)]